MNVLVGTNSLFWWFCVCSAGSERHPEALQQGARQLKLQQVLVLTTQIECFRDLFIQSFVIFIVISVWNSFVNQTLHLLWILHVSSCRSKLSFVVVVLIFSFQSSRKSSVRLQALSFYLQEKKVKILKSSVSLLLSVSNSPPHLQCFPEKADITAALDLMLQVQTHLLSVCLMFTFVLQNVLTGSETCVCGSAATLTEQTKFYKVYLHVKQHVVLSFIHQVSDWHCDWWCEFVFTAEEEEESVFVIKHKNETR